MNLEELMASTPPMQQHVLIKGFQAGAASRDAYIEQLELALLQVRKAICGDIHNTDDLFDLIASRDAEIQRLQFALADSEALELGTAERCDQLRAQINVLRDAFQTFIDEHEECQDADEWMAELCSMEALHVAGEALATTPKQSLAEYRNEAIEDCAKRIEAYAYMSQNFNALAEELRAMKEQP